MFSENLKTLRKQKGYTQEELAARLNVVRQTVSKWEKGLSVPDAELLLRLKTRAPALPARLLSYKCVGTQAGLILCLRCEIQVRPGVRKRCLAAFSPTPVSDGGNYDALIGGTIG